MANSVLFRVKMSDFSDVPDQSLISSEEDIVVRFTRDKIKNLNKQKTRRPLDLEIVGPGFFCVELINGERAYTRKGFFRKTSSGQIQDRFGNPLVSEVCIPKDAKAIEINSEGIVRSLAGDREILVGKIDLFTFKNPAGLESLGDYLFSPSFSSGEACKGQPGKTCCGFIVQGSIEASFIDTKKEILSLI